MTTYRQVQVAAIIGEDRPDGEQGAVYKVFPRKAPVGRTVKVAGAVGAALLTAAAWASLRGGIAAPRAVSKAVSFVAVLTQTAERLCVAFEGARLADGRGKASGSGKAAGSPQACTERCRQSEDCRQTVFAAGNQGCYMFNTPVEGFKEFRDDNGKGASGSFSSSVCGQAKDVAAASVGFRASKLGAVRKSWDVAEGKAKYLVSKLKPWDKYSLLHGVNTGSGFAGYVSPQAGEARPLAMNDGPQGFNTYSDLSRAGTSTQFPCLLAVAASFSPHTAQQFAAAIMDEFVAKGANVLLGPDLEVVRVGSTGRSFETLSGEDPHLGSQLAPAFVAEVQGRGIIATIKHWLDNNQEIRRMSMNSEVGERAQHEIYMAPFKAAIDAGAGAVMCAYNSVYGTHACENKRLLKDLLRHDAGFRGFVMSDWGATHDAGRSVDGGLDVEMPGDKGTFNQLPAMVDDGRVSGAAVDAMAAHVLTSMYEAGQYGGRYPGGAVNNNDVTTDAHREVATQVIIDSAILLKNREETLPLATKGKKIAMIGKMCQQTTVHTAPGVTPGDTGTPFMGQGSGYVPTRRTSSLLNGLKTHAPGAASVSWSADASAAKNADVAIVCASQWNVHEGWDRMDFELPEAGDLVAAVRKQGGNTRIVVVGIIPGAVTTWWAHHADAVLLLLMPGEQAAEAAGRLLTGAASPAGRLPVTLPPNGWKPLGGWPAGKDHQFLTEQYPGTQPKPFAQYKWGQHLVANFTEGTLVGYRWFDAKHVKPGFPFGYGLTYTTFSYDGFKAECADDRVVVSFTITNTGRRAGKAVPQMYVSFPSLLPTVRQLRGFQKLEVAAGATVGATFVMTPEDASYFDEAKKRWVSAVEKRERVTVSVGASSGHILWKESTGCGLPALEVK